MKSYAFCPISEEKIDERVARCNAIFTVIFLVIFAITWFIPLLIFLWIDFFLRGTSRSKYSLLTITSKLIVNHLPAGNYLINVGPKIFAARVGLMFVSIISALLIIDYSVTALIFMGILALFSFLEGVFGICVACIIYPYLYRIVYKRNFNDV